jgi:hypothetical protein
MERTTLKHLTDDAIVRLSRPFLQTLKELERKYMSDLDILSQFAIDFLELWDDEFGDDYDEINWETPGALCYRWENLKQEVDKNRTTFKILRDFCKVANEWNDSIDEAIKIAKSIDPDKLDQLIQLLNCTEDGNLISKSDRDFLVGNGYAAKSSGYNIITWMGIHYLHTIGKLD